MFNKFQNWVNEWTKNSIVKTTIAIFIMSSIIISLIIGTLTLFVYFLGAGSLIILFILICLLSFSYSIAKETMNE